MFFQIVTILLLSIVGARAGSTKPHILFVVADDYGYNDVGYHQNAKSSANPEGLPTTNPAAGLLPTPTIDKLAAEGVKLENYYVQPLCSPTRSTIMTGRYPSHTGIGPDVIMIDWPYGVPAREVFFAERLQAAGYRTHAVGKWHLGACDERYVATYRGFDSYVGYLSGGQGYYNQAGDRNGSAVNELPKCLGPACQNNYSSVFFANEAVRIVNEHDINKPLFVYLAFQSVHNPYDVPPIEHIDINKTFPEIVNYERRIYAGMVVMLDRAVAQVTEAFETKGIWDDTVLIFTADNGGIGPGSNYPLRGLKVLNWEGGIKAVGFVRGTNSNIRPLPAGTISNALFHSTDWFPTVCEIAQADLGNGLPLDGYNQWDVMRGVAETNRTTIFHNVPVVAKPIPLNISGRTQYSTSTCMSYVDNRTGTCHPFGVTGGAMRYKDFKLLITHGEPAPWEDSSPPGIIQILPGGRYKNGTDVFVPSTNNSVPEPFQGHYYVFNIAKDPTETNNLASNATLLKLLLDMYNSYAETAVPDLSWRWGFLDPNRGNNPGDTVWPMDFATQSPSTCSGPFLESQYCAYGHEFECYVYRTTLTGTSISSSSETTTAACQAKCLDSHGCKYWTLDSKSHTCELMSEYESIQPCETCAWGPQSCPK
eukprot:m.95015 g.95015  ORF g.95015 m.95015 type:complete len:649 (-) comp13473_c0_seq4:141-2087(-)